MGILSIVAGIGIFTAAASGCLLGTRSLDIDYAGSEQQTELGSPDPVNARKQIVWAR